MEKAPTHEYYHYFCNTDMIWIDVHELDYEEFLQVHSNCEYVFLGTKYLIDLDILTSKLNIRFNTEQILHMLQCETCEYDPGCGCCSYTNECKELERLKD